MILIGTAGWGIPRAEASLLDCEGTGLQRYASAMRCVEINSSFYRPHRRKTYERWASSTPDAFRFSVKMPRDLTHEARLQPADYSVLERFLDEVSGLGAKLGPLLLQMPKSLEFDSRVAGAFFESLRERWAGAVVCEPRHSSWFTRGADRLLEAFQLGRVAADPSATPSAAHPVGYCSVDSPVADYYYRWHGSPRTYWSPYSIEALERLAVELRTLSREGRTWCIFDNTASGAALRNALQLRQLITRGAA